jgi:heme exporter protein A
MLQFNEYLSLQSISLTRGERNLVSNLNLHLAPGESLALTGANGAGKSSLLRAIAGLLPYEGVINRADLLHYAGHLDPVKSYLTVEENLKFWCDFENTPVKGLEIVGLSNIKHLQGAVLSAGQKRRLTLARLIAIPRSLWLLDEPTAALDHAGCELLDQLIADHTAKGGIVVVATHQRINALSREFCLTSWQEIEKGILCKIIRAFEMTALKSTLVKGEKDEITPLLSYVNLIFGSKERADLWLRSPNTNLEGKTPKQAIRSKLGREKINGMMLKVEHGIY